MLWLGMSCALNGHSRDQYSFEINALCNCSKKSLILSFWNGGQSLMNKTDWSCFQAIIDVLIRMLRTRRLRVSIVLVEQATVSPVGCVFSYELWRSTPVLILGGLRRELIFVEHVLIKALAFDNWRLLMLNHRVANFEIARNEETKR